MRAYGIKRDRNEDYRKDAVARRIAVYRKYAKIIRRAARRTAKQNAKNWRGSDNA